MQTEKKRRKKDDYEQYYWHRGITLTGRAGLLACLHLITRSVGLAVQSDILESGRERSRGGGAGKGGWLLLSSSVKGRDCGVESSGRRREYARLLGAFLAAAVASLGGVSVLSWTGEACCCACGDSGGG